MSTPRTSHDLRCPEISDPLASGPDPQRCTCRDDTGHTVRSLGHLEPGTDEWLAARARRVGGSEIAAVLGISPYESRFSLWHRKRGAIGPVEETDEMRWGKLLEPVVARQFADLHPDLDVRPAATLVPAGRPWQTAAPDRLVYKRGAPVAVYEGKTARMADEWGTPGTDEVPVHYRAQCLWYLDALNLPTCHLAVLIGGSDYREYLIHHDAAETQLMREAAAEFITSINADQRPSIDAHDSTYQAVKQLHPDIDDIAVEVPAEIADAYRAACLAYDGAKAVKQQAAAALADAMGDARRATCGDESVAMRVPGRAGAPPHLRPAHTTRKKAAA